MVGSQSLPKELWIIWIVFVNALFLEPSALATQVYIQSFCPGLNLQLCWLGFRWVLDLNQEKFNIQTLKRAIHRCLCLNPILGKY